MADDASRKFELYLTDFLSTFSSNYLPLQSPGSWHTCHPPSEIVSLVISALRKHAFEADTSPVTKLPGSTETGWPSAPKCRTTTHSRTQKYPLWKSFKCLESGFMTKLSRTGCQGSGQTRLLRRGALLPRSTHWKAAPTPVSPLDPAAATWTNASPACSAIGGTRTPPHEERKQSLTAAHRVHRATAYGTSGFHSNLRFWRRL